MRVLLPTRKQFTAQIPNRRLGAIIRDESAICRSQTSEADIAYLSSEISNLRAVSERVIAVPDVMGREGGLTIRRDC
jgi:hypothetical protein